MYHLNLLNDWNSPSKFLTSVPHLALRPELVTFDRWICLLNATWNEVCLDCDFLFREQSDIGFEGLEADEVDLDVVGSRGNLHGAADTAELIYRARKASVDEDGCAVRSNFQLDFGSDGGELGLRVSFQVDGERGFLARLDNDFLREFEVTGLTGGNFVFSGEEEDFFVALEFIYVADVLAVDPNAGGFLRLSGGGKGDFTHNLISAGGDLCADSCWEEQGGDEDCAC
jgi:hypothetical protein